MVAVCKESEDGDNYIVLSPCGNCRQLIIDYAPECSVILSNDGEPTKTQAKNLLLCSYKSCFA